ncbi:hypothetical protein Ndes2526A_g05532 [Nannochloris sp. 'desiccata']
MSKSQRKGAEASLAGFLASLKSNEHFSQKLNIVAKSITKIGNAIPPQYEDAKVLYLSRNNLRTLNNVQQFTNLRAFSAADNLLPSFSSVASLQELTTLEAVSLEGNPLTDLPNYRHRMISMLSKSPLHQLDGKPVTLEDKKTADAVCGVEDAMLNLAVNTTCLINSFNRAHQVFNMHSEMYSMLWPSELKTAGGRHRQKCIARLVSQYEKQRLSLEFDDDILNNENEEIEANVVAEVVFWHEKALKTGASKPSSPATTWHAAFCRILADRAAKLEELVRSTTASDSAAAAANASFEKEGSLIEEETSTAVVLTGGGDLSSSNVASVFVSIRHALQKVSMLRPGSDENATKQAEELRKHVIKLQNTLVQELISGVVDGDMGEGNADFCNWVIPAAGGAGAGASPLRNGAPPRPTSSLNCPVALKIGKVPIDMTTVAAQNIVATESVARLEISLNLAEAQAQELNEKLFLAARKLDSAEAENQLLRQDQIAAKEANAALQHWLENANSETEELKQQAKVLIERIRQAREMHAAEIENLENQIETLQRQIEDSESLLRSDASEHENAISKLESEIETLQQHQYGLEVELQAALHEAAEVEKQPMQPVKLEINVFLAREVELEKAKNIELTLQVQKREKEAAALAAELESVVNLQKQQAEAAEEVLLGKIARKFELERLEEYGIALQARRIAASGLAALRLATKRSKKMAALELQKTQHVRFQLFSTWNNYTKSALLLRTLNKAAVASSKFAFMQRIFFAWRATSAHLKYQSVAELSENDPRVHLAAEIFNQRYLISPFQAWRNHTQTSITNNEALIVFSVAQRQSEILKNAFAMWREATEIHREESHETLLGIAARKVVFSRQVLRAWQRATRRATALAIAEAAATRASKRTLLAKALAAWRDCRNKSAEEACIVRKIEESEALEAQQRDLALRAAEKKAESRAYIASVALKRHIFSTWRTEVAYNKHIDAISTWCASSTRRQLLLRSLASWRTAVYGDQVVELAHQKGQIEASLRAASLEIASKEQDIEAVNASRLQALSRVEELEGNVAAAEDELAAAAREASLLEERLEKAENAKIDAEEFEEEAVLAAEAAVAFEQQARRAAVEACQQGQEERDKALSSALVSNSEATAALEACKIAEQRVQAAEESRVEAEIVAIDALESVEAAASACERLAEEATGLHIALNEANQRYTALQERYLVAMETIDTLKEGEERYLEEQLGFKQQIKTAQQRWRDAEEAKEVAESDAHVAMRQSQQLAGMLEQQVQHEAHPLALIYR